MTGLEVVTVGRIVHNLPVAPLTSPVHSTRLSDFFLFGHLKKHLAGKRFVTDADMKQDSPRGYRNLPPISSSPGYSPWCNNETND